MYQINLDGKKREIRFTTRALYELEIKLDEPVAHFMSSPLKMASFKVLTAILWAGQIHTKDPLTHDEVIDLLEIEDFADTVTLCNSALIEALGGDPDAEISEAAAKKAKKKA